MTVTRHGNRLGFFDGTSTYNATTNLGGGVNVPVGAFSAPQEIGRTTNSLAVFLKVGAGAFITKWQLQASHSGGMNNSQGEPIDQDAVTQIWHDVWYYGMVPVTEPYGTQGATNVSFWLPSGGGAVVNYLPDFVSGWIRLARVDTSNAAVTVSAGWESESE